MLDREDEYTDAILKEAKEYSGTAVDTMYFGGGTPSVLSGKSLYRLMSTLKSIFKVPREAEITAEVNPKTADREKLAMLKALGVNRLSIGVQAFSDKTLKTLGRIHSADDAKNVVLNARSIGFDNISVDLMFSVPGQTIAEFENSVKTAVNLGVNHVSCYGLKIEPGTVFYKKGVECLPEDVDREMYRRAKNILCKNGFYRYEISNFARKGYESEHNLIYWKCAEYVGLGCGAHSYLNGKRYANTEDIEKYISDCGRTHEEEYVLNEYDKTEEKLIMGMRLAQGVEYALVEKLGTVDILNKYIDMGYIEKYNDRIKFTDKGFDISNYILSELI